MRTAIIKTLEGGRLRGEQKTDIGLYLKSSSAAQLITYTHLNLKKAFFAIMLCGFVSWSVYKSAAKITEGLSSGGNGTLAMFLFSIKNIPEKVADI